MPEIVTYKRGYKHTGGRGHQGTTLCGFCGRIVPRHKTFTTYRGFRLNDPLLKREIDPRNVSFGSQKIYVCPSCARHRGIVQKRDDTGFKVTKKRFVKKDQ
jgi:small subunit ribosomal protein S26e